VLPLKFPPVLPSRRIIVPSKGSMRADLDARRLPAPGVGWVAALRPASW
jgi:hypothetical protein